MFKIPQHRESRLPLISFSSSATNVVVNMAQAQERQREFPKLSRHKSPHPYENLPGPWQRPASLKPRQPDVLVPHVFLSKPKPPWAALNYPLPNATLTTRVERRTKAPGLLPGRYLSSRIPKERNWSKRLTRPQKRLTRVKARYRSDLGSLQGFDCSSEVGCLQCGKSNVLLSISAVKGSVKMEIA